MEFYARPKSVVCSQAVLCVGETFTTAMFNFPDAAESPLIVNRDLHFPPVVRAGPPLRHAFVGEDIEIYAGDSYSQYRGYKPIERSQFSIRSDQGGGASSGYGRRTFNWGTPGLKEVHITVSDESGAESSGIRWVRVTSRPGTGDPDSEPITSFQYFGPEMELRDRGWGGCSIRVVVQGRRFAEQFKKGTNFCIRLFEWESDGFTTGSENWGSPRSSLIFSGWVQDVKLETGVGRDEFSFTGVGADGLLGQVGMDTTMQFFFNAALADQVYKALSDPSGGMLDGNPLGIYMTPWHIMEPLTFGRVTFHLLRYHVGVSVTGASVPFYDFLGVTDLIRDWWNDNPLRGTDLSTIAIPFMGVQRGPLRRAIEGMQQQGLWLAYGDHLGGFVLTPIHAMKGIGSEGPPDASNDVQMEFNEGDLFHPIEPQNGEAHPVRKVRMRGTTGLNAYDVKVAEIIYDDGGRRGGEYDATGWGFWVELKGTPPTVPNYARAFAIALHKELNATDVINLHLRGQPLSLNAIARVKCPSLASQFNWSNRQAIVYKVHGERNHEFLGSHRSRYTLRTKDE